MSLARPLRLVALLAGRGHKRRGRSWQRHHPAGRGAAGDHRRNLRMWRYTRADRDRPRKGVAMSLQVLVVW